MLLLGCSKSNNQEINSEPSGEDAVMESEGISENGSPAANEFISSSAAVVQDDSSKKFIRTANMKFRVNSVREATTSLEDITAQFDGFVTYTNLESRRVWTETIPVSADSSLETIHYDIVNNLVVRVPDNNLDTTLRAMASLIDFLDYRTIVAEDVTLSLLEKQLEQQRMNSYSERVTKSIYRKGNKLDETTYAEESVLNKRERADDAKLASLRIKDKIDFSTINLEIYQRESIKRSLISNNKNIEEYEPGFFSQLWEAIQSGWNLLKVIILGLAGIWPLLLIGILGLFLIKWYNKRKKKS